MNYLLIANGLLVLFFLIFWFGFRKFTFFQWNRIFLLGSLILSFLLPSVLWMNINFETFESPIFRLPELVLSNQQNIHETQTANDPAAIDWMSFLPYVYWIGVGLSLMLFIVKLYRVLRPSKSNDGKQSFSFLKWICVGDQLKDNSVILKHEEIHKEQGHSIDLLLVEVIQLFNWFNPIFYFFKKELKLQHEFLVDDRFQEDRVAYAEMLVAYAMKVDRFQLSHEFSNQSLLKERIKMLFHNKTKTAKQLYYLVLIPFSLVMLTLIINCKGSISKANDAATAEQSSTNEKVTESNVADQTEQPVNKVVTASANEEELIRFPEPKVVAKKEEVIVFPEPIKGEVKKQVKAIGEEIHPVPVVKEARKAVVKDTSDKKVYAYGTTEIWPEYPGGLDVFRKEVMLNVLYPQSAIDAGVKGISEVQFDIDKEGNIGNFKVTRALGYGIEESVIAALKKSKKWKPAIKDGQAVITKFLIPIRMDLTKM